ncbi:MAG TPA: hypothetical protein VM580_19200 [Labilithrix sp.]|jgi:hypothetical protein|nr:hypothetical protein [Labilithrix sp.]
MFQSAILPRENEETESRVLIDDCLARVEADPALGSQPVLQPLHSLLVKRPVPPPLPARIVAEPTRVAVAPAKAELPARAPVLPTGALALDRKLGRLARWTVFVCALVGGIFGGVGLMKSPLGRHPAVQQVAKQIRAKVAHAGARIAAANAR